MGGIPAGLEAGVCGFPADGAAAGPGGVRYVVLSEPRGVKRVVLSPFPGVLHSFFDDAVVLRVSIRPAGQWEEGERGCASSAAAGGCKAAAVCAGGAELVWLVAAGSAVFPAEWAVPAPDWLFSPLLAGEFLPANCIEAVYRVEGTELL